MISFDIVISTIMNRDTFKMQRAVNLRVHCLISDGYIQIVATEFDDRAFFKLRHWRNRKVITLYVNYKENWLVQKTEGLSTYVGNII